MSGNPRRQPAMTQPIMTREIVAQRLSLPTRVLLRYESLGLIRSTRQDEVEGYGPEEIRRLWTVLTLHRELGVNLAGIEAILRLRDHIDELHAHVATLAVELREALEAELDSDRDRA